jgi:hypothetical protein
VAPVVGRWSLVPSVIRRAPPAGLIARSELLSREPVPHAGPPRRRVPEQVVRARRGNCALTCAGFGQYPSPQATPATLAGRTDATPTTSFHLRPAPRRREAPSDLWQVPSRRRRRALSSGRGKRWTPYDYGYYPGGSQGRHLGWLLSRMDSDKGTYARSWGGTRPTAFPCRVTTGRSASAPIGPPIWVTSNRTVVERGCCVARQQAASGEGHPGHPAGHSRRGRVPAPTLGADG